MLKHLATTFLFSAFAVCVRAQTVTDYQPDANGDGCIGSADIISLLTLYGTGTGACPQSTCGEPLNYQGYDYATVQIGGRCWFAENLRSENYENGEVIPAGLSDGEWSSTTLGATAVYGENADNLETYGRLYNWYTVDDERGLCPSGWHVPTDWEWMTMEMALGMSEAEANEVGWRGTGQGTHMKTAYAWDSGGNGTNSSGFSGLPGGMRWHDGSFDGRGEGGGWWSSSSVASYAWRRVLTDFSGNVHRDYMNGRLGSSVRCIKD